MQYIDRSSCHIRIATVVSSIAGEMAVLGADALSNWPVREMQAGLESEMTETVTAHAGRFDVGSDDVVVLFGRAADEIRKYCESNDIDLVVLGLHRTSTSDLGSTTLGVLQNAPCDVLTIRLGSSA